METDKFKTSVFLVLVPHQDARGEIRKHSQLLLKKSLSGRYIFPYVAPIALLKKPFTPDELKITAKNLRIAASGEKFQTSETICTHFPAHENSLRLLGPRLNIDIDLCAMNCAPEKIKKQITAAVIGLYLIPETSEQQVDAVPQINLSFRAAAAANLFWRPVRKNGEIYYKWKIGKLSWLPRTLQKL